MKFNSTAYDKVFPREVPKPVVETSVETFTPTADEQIEVPIVENTLEQPSEEGGTDGQYSESDIEQ